MSYEGYEQHICSDGHYFRTDAYATFYDEKVKCDCGKPSIWCNGVDETNCEGIGYIDMDQFIIKSAQYETCNLGHKHMTAKATYKVPSEEEATKARTFRTEDGKLLPLSKYDEYWESK